MATGVSKYGKTLPQETYTEGVRVSENLNEAENNDNYPGSLLA